VSSNTDAYPAHKGRTANGSAMVDHDTGAQAALLLGPDEPPAVEIVNAGGRSNAVLVCDHASHRVPERLGTLGLDPLVLAEHISWDRGAADVARRLSAHLDAPLVLSGYSRLVIDCNRPLCNAQSIAERSTGVFIPGNRALGWALGRTGDFAIGDNEPYPIEDDIDYTIPLHGESRGLPCAMIEIRQDGILTEAGAAVWAARLAAAYRLVEFEVLRLSGSSFET
jgi:predicted N-formylglutamate amidohydrolase